METLHGNTVQEQLQEIEHIKKARLLASKINNIKIAMLTTLIGDGKANSSPMYTFELQDDGIIWMFISKESQKVKQIQLNANIVLNYSDPQQDLYVSVNATAELSEDAVKIQELWSDRFKMWFPYGIEDPNLALLKIVPQEAEYWDTPDLLLAQVVNLVKHTMGGSPYENGENKTIRF